jgi:uncharacterized protein (DUF2237 family)
MHLLIVFVVIQANIRPMNVLGSELEPCSVDTNKPTGWYRDGYCNTDSHDSGSHLICSEMTAEFLSFSKSVGNDLSTPRLP